MTITQFYLYMVIVHCTMYIGTFVHKLYTVYVPTYLNKNKANSQFDGTLLVKIQSIQYIIFCTIVPSRCFFLCIMQIVSIALL